MLSPGSNDASPGFNPRLRLAYMEGTSLFVWGMVFGIIGLGFFTYGKRQGAVVPLLTGIALFIFPYFIADVYMLVIAGCILVMIPYFVQV